MAGDWLKWSCGFARKPEVMMIATRLGRTRHEVAGILMEVFEWADANVVIDSGASGFDPDACPGVVQLGEQSKQLLDAIAGVSGLADAMTAVGWLQARSGSLVFPNFGRHNGKSAKARALDSARKRAGRVPPPDETRNGVPDASGSEPDGTRIREEKSREEDKTPPAGGDRGRTDDPTPDPADTSPPPKPPAPGPASVPIPAGLDAPAFRAAWGAYLAHRAAMPKAKRLSASGAQIALKKLAAYGPAVAAEICERAVMNGWQGLVFDGHVPAPSAAPAVKRATDGPSVDPRRMEQSFAPMEVPSGRIE
jgi:hypothetical protein